MTTEQDDGSDPTQALGLSAARSDEPGATTDSGVDHTPGFEGAEEETAAAADPASSIGESATAFRPPTGQDADFRPLAEQFAEATPGEK